MFHPFFQAISNPTNNDLQEVAWNQVLPLVTKLKSFYEFSMEIGKESYYLVYTGSLPKFMYHEFVFRY